MISSLELARLCGVSQGTVDRALHDRPGIAKKTRERILQLAAEHGYRPNPAAQELLHGQRRLITAVLPTRLSPLAWDLMLGLQHAVPGKRLVQVVADNALQAVDHLADAAARRHHAAVVIMADDMIRLRRSLTQDFPICAIGEPCPGACEVLVDERAAGTAAAEALLGNKRRGIAFIGNELAGEAEREQVAGYEQAARAAGIEPLVLADPDVDTIVSAVRGGIDGLICRSVVLAQRIQAHLATARIVAGADVGLVSFGSPSARQLDPRVSMMAYPVADAIAATIRCWEGAASTERLRYGAIEGQTL